MIGSPMSEFALEEKEFHAMIVNTCACALSIHEQIWGKVAELAKLRKVVEISVMSRTFNSIESWLFSCNGHKLSSVLISSL